MSVPTGFQFHSQIESRQIPHIIREAGGDAARERPATGALDAKWRSLRPHSEN